MYAYADDRTTILDSISTKCDENFDRRYFTSVPFVLRAIIVGFGLISTCLAFLGFQNDATLSNDTETTRITDTIETEPGYGLGYKTEKLSEVYAYIVSICLIISVIHLSFLICTNKTEDKGTTVNQSLQFFLGILFLIGAICGKVGMEQFREKCCRVILFSGLPNKTGIYYKYSNLSEFGYNVHCLCTIFTDQSVALTTYQWNPNYAGKELLAAIPHHQGTLSSSIMMAMTNCILYLFAVCFP